MNAHVSPGGSSYPSPAEKGVRPEKPSETVLAFLEVLVAAEPSYAHAKDGLVLLGYPGVEYRFPISALQAHKR